MKRKTLVILLAACMILMTIVGLASCDKNDQPAPTPQKLSTPVVTLTDNVATWSSDENADKFEISVDGNLSYVESSVTSRILTDGQTFKIRAVGDGNTYSTSDWSNVVTYTAPTQDTENNDETTTTPETTVKPETTVEPETTV